MPAHAMSRTSCRRSGEIFVRCFFSLSLYSTHIHTKRTANATTDRTAPTFTACQMCVPAVSKASRTLMPIRPNATPVNSSSTVSQKEWPVRRSSAVMVEREDISTAAMTIAITPEAWIASQPA